MTVYHWTPLRNLRGIIKQGLLLAHCRGKVPCIWFCHKSRLWHWRNKIARLYKVDTNRLILIRTNLSAKVLGKPIRGTFRVRADVKPERLNLDVLGRMAAEANASDPLYR